MEKVNHPVFRSQHNGGARGKGQAIQLIMHNLRALVLHTDCRRSGPSV